MAETAPFNRRERELAALMASGVDVKPISATLDIAVSTAYSRIRRMCEKVQVPGRLQLTIYILQHPDCLLPDSKSSP